MAKIDIRFIDCLDDGDFIQVKNCYVDCGEVIKISGFEQEKPFTILLDKSTAIRFAKTLRTEINKITESEVDNG